MATKEKFLVTITRTETYVHECVVEAENEREARRKVMEYDDNDGFANEWMELDPSTETEYDAMPVSTCDPEDMDRIARLEVVE